MLHKLIPWNKDKFEIPFPEQSGKVNYIVISGQMKKEEKEVLDH